VLAIQREVIKDIIAHAKQEEPGECCGILAGRDNLITRLFKLTNIQTDPDRYEMDPKEQVQAFEEIDRSNMELLGIYHSHPHSPAFPSLVDISRAFYPTIAFFIISLLNEENPELKAFEIVERKVKEKTFAVLP
jgi:proteasome lid subunit RPN8/RPN11